MRCAQKSASVRKASDAVETGTSASFESDSWDLSIAQRAGARVDIARHAPP